MQIHQITNFRSQGRLSNSYPAMGAPKMMSRSNLYTGKNINFGMTATAATLPIAIPIHMFHLLKSAWAERQAFCQNNTRFIAGSAQQNDLSRRYQLLISNSFDQQNKHFSSEKGLWAFDLWENLKRNFNDRAIGEIVIASSDYYWLRDIGFALKMLLANEEMPTAWRNKMPIVKLLYTGRQTLNELRTQEIRTAKGFEPDTDTFLTHEKAIESAEFSTDEFQEGPKLKIHPKYKPGITTEGKERILIMLSIGRTSK